MRRRSALLLFGFVACSIQPACGSKNSVTGPSGTACRTYATSQTGPITSTSGQSGTFTQTCTNYDKTTNQVTCTVTSATVNPTTNTNTVIAATYASVSDFVDEIKAIPIVNHPMRQVFTTNGQPSGTGTWSYDNQGRATQFVIVGPNGTETETFAGWDSAGRYTQATDVTAAGTQHITYSYNESTKTMTIANAGIAFVGVYTFNSNGDIIKQVVTNNGVTSTIEATVTASFQVCK